MSRTEAPSLIAGRYEVGGLLGRGGMADVYAGVDRRLSRPVAVKLLQARMAERTDIRHRFEAEARAAAALSEPHVVAVYDTGEQAGVPYIVMERLPGETLADRIAGGPLPADQVRRIADQVLSALAAAHAAGIVHRDVKPGNILLTAEGDAKIADFGIAKSLDVVAAGDLTGTGQILGTPAYLAPEQIDGRPATPRTDLYALGVVLYEALAGRKPFEASTPISAARAVAAGAYQPLAEARPGLDPALVATVERAMATDPARRFASAGAMAAAMAGDRAAGAATSPLPAAGPDTTQVIDATAVAPMAPASPPVPAFDTGRPGTGFLAGRRRPSMGVRVAVLVALAVLGLALVAGAMGSGSSPGTGPSNPAEEAAPAEQAAPSPSAPLVADIRAFADRLSPADGDRADDLADRLGTLAGEVEGGGGGASATGLIVDVARWRQSGDLVDGATVTALRLLQAVPGATAPVVTTAAPPPTTAAVPNTRAPATAPSRDRGDDDERSGRSEDRGKSKSDDDD